MKHSGDNPSSGCVKAIVISLAIGIAVGAFLGAKFDDSNLSALGSLSFIRYRENIVESFLSFFASSASLVAVMFVMGFCAVFQPLEIMLAAFKGLGLGAAVSSIYSSGVGFSDSFPKLALFVLFSALSTGILILQAKDAFLMSSSYFSISVTTENRIGMANEFRVYIFRFFIYILACAAISAVGCLALREMYIYSQA